MVILNFPYSLMQTGASNTIYTLQKKKINKFITSYHICLDVPQERAIYAANFPNARKVIQKINFKYYFRKNPHVLPNTQRNKEIEYHISAAVAAASIIILVSNKRNKKPATSVTQLHVLYPPFQQRQITKPQRSCKNSWGAAWSCWIKILRKYETQAKMTTQDICQYWYPKGKQAYIPRILKVLPQKSSHIFYLCFFLLLIKCIV